MSTSREHYRHDFEKHVLDQQKPSEFASKKRLHGGCSRRMMHVASVAERDEEARVEDDHRSSSVAVYDSVDLLAEPLVARRELPRLQGAEGAGLLAPARPADIRADRLVDGVADCPALERSLSLEGSVGAKVQVSDGGIHVCGDRKLQQLQSERVSGQPNSIRSQFTNRVTNAPSTSRSSSPTTDPMNPGVSLVASHACT